jgi:hypothetical protein
MQFPAKELLVPYHPLYSLNEMLGQLDMIRHPEVGLGLLLVLTATAIAPAAADDIALAALMTADGVGIARLVGPVIRRHIYCSFAKVSQA